MVVRAFIVIALGCFISCSRLSSDEQKLVGSWNLQAAPDSHTTFTFEANHTHWVVVSLRDDSWLDGSGHWHVEGKQLVFDHVRYPAVSAEVAAKDPSLTNRPQNYSVAIEDLGQDTLRFQGVTFKRCTRPPRPSKPAPFSP
jgi:hypothetical protein